MEHLTAKMSCFARAYHYKNNASHIFADAAAEALLGADYNEIAQSLTRGVGFFLPDFRGSAEKGLRLIADRQLSPSVLGRSAYCEKMLENETRLGCRQYVIFASGYDTFAIRSRDKTLRVYELDLPEMLADKRTRAERADLTRSATDVPCDLSGTLWKDKLLESGFRRDRKAFCSLLGISYYLGAEELASLLKTLGEILCEGSAVCMDYPAKYGGREARVNQTLARGAGEEMKACYEERELEALLNGCGFLTYEHLDHQEMTKQYFSAYNERCPAHRMEAPEGIGYLLAVRKPL